MASINLVLDEQGNVVRDGEFVVILNEKGNCVYIRETELGALLDGKTQQDSSSGLSSCLNTEVQEKENVEKETNKVWSAANTKLLIKLYDEHQPDFEKYIKKTVQQKIAIQLQKLTNINYTYTQVDTKWKGLVKYYKEVVVHNSTSGMSKKEWEFFDGMHAILFNKPEINPIATCSSHSGLKVRENLNTPSTSSASVSPSQSKTNTKVPKENYESSFSKKRKAKEEAIERRHREKMERLDRLQHSIDKIGQNMVLNNDKTQE